MALDIQTYTGVVNVKDYGAVGDGVTDDTAAIQAALDVGGNIRIPSGSTFLVNDSLVIDNDDVNFKIDGTLVAGSGLTGKPFIHVTKNSGATVIKSFNITSDGNGIIDGNQYAEAGIRVDYARDSRINKLRLIGSTLYGIHVGATDTYQSIEVHTSDVEVWFNDDTSGSLPLNTEDSIGIYYDNISDSSVFNPVVVGYRTGIQTEKGNVRFVNSHCWTRHDTQGAMQHAYYIKGNSNSLVGVYADTPSIADQPVGETALTECFGIKIDDNVTATQISAFRVFMNLTHSQDGVTIPIFLGENTTGCISGVGLFTGTGGRRFKKVIDGDLSGWDILGVGHIDSSLIVDLDDYNNILSAIDVKLNTDLHIGVGTEDVRLFVNSPPSGGTANAGAGQSTPANVSEYMRVYHNGTEFFLPLFEVPWFAKEARLAEGNVADLLVESSRYAVNQTDLGAPSFLPLLSSTAFSNWWNNAAQGTLLFKANVTAIGSSLGRLLHLDDGSTANAIYVELSSTLKAQARTIVSSTAEYTTTLNSGVLSTDITVAVAFGSGGVSVSMNGGAVVSQTRTIPSGLTRMYIGQDPTASAAATPALTLERVGFFPVKISNEALQILSAT